MIGFRGELGEEEVGTQRRGGTRDEKKLQGTTGNWVQAKNGKVGSKPARETAEDADAGTWSGERHRNEQQQLVGAGYVHMVSTLYRNCRWGVGVNERALMMNSWRWGGGSKEW